MKKHALFLIITIQLLMNQSIAQNFMIDKGDTVNYMTKDSIKTGLWREYWDNGTIKSEVTYENNKKNGLELIWQKKPHCLSLQSIYINDLLDGTVTHYSKKCKKELEENFKNGIKNGREITYHANGNMMSDGMFKDGKLYGLYKVYKKNGEFAFESKAKKEEADLKNLSTDTATSVVYKVFERNPGWKRKLIVTDLTGSMYPYASQLLMWYQLHFLKDTTTQQFVFFNDGDNKKDNQKKIGQTGGIYTCRAQNVEELKKKMMETMQNGGGGDAPENDVEAILEGMGKFKKYDEIILIADNYANIKDIKLSSKIKKPVHIILCGSDATGINTDYLDLAYITKGSVHTIEDDILNISETLEGKTIIIYGIEYKLIKGKFERVTSL